MTRYNEVVRIYSVTDMIVNGNTEIVSDIRIKKTFR